MTSDSSYQPPANLLRERNILITGAGDGIGKALALACASHGAQVLLLGRTQSKLESVYDQIVAAGHPPPLLVPSDLAELNEDRANEVADAVHEQLGVLHGLVHNAAQLGPRVPLQFYPERDWREVMQVNTTAPFLLTRALLPALTGAPSASVIFMTSSVGSRARAYWGAYAVSKSALEGLAHVLADELDQTSGVRVNIVNPGRTRTAMRATAFPAEDPRSLPAPAAHCRLLLWLLGDDSSTVNGQRIDAKSWLEH